MGIGNQKQVRTEQKRCRQNEKIRKFIFFPEVKYPGKCEGEEEKKKHRKQRRIGYSGQKDSSGQGEGQEEEGERHGLSFKERSFLIFDVLLELILLRIFQIIQS